MKKAKGRMGQRLRGMNAINAQGGIKMESIPVLKLENKQSMVKNEM
jgi:hypothetical protein